MARLKPQNPVVERASARTREMEELQRTDKQDQSAWLAWLQWVFWRQWLPETICKCGPACRG